MKGDKMVKKRNILKRNVKNSEDELELDSKEIISKLKEISKKKDTLIKEQSKLEVERDNLEDELKELKSEVKKEFGTLDEAKLEKCKEDLLKEANKLIKEIGDF